MSRLALVTGSAGLIGAEAVRFLIRKGFDVVGIDNNLRADFFGSDASTLWSRQRLIDEHSNYTHHDVDIRSEQDIDSIFSEYQSDLELIIHTAAQPSHDWAASAPMVDFSVNATGTLNLLEATRQHTPNASFIFTSTNKVYGDNPNRLPLVELETRWEVDSSHPYFANGIDETMSVDQTKHSLFGSSKLAADALVQEYGQYFGMNTVCFRGGCLTGPGHSGTKLHGFLSYLAKCCVTGEQYTVFGYQGKQVRDNIHSLDLVKMFWEYHQNPQPGKVYNAGGGRFSNCSMQEAIHMCEEIVGQKMNFIYSDENRIGDHIWYISDTSRFQEDYPSWKQEYGIEEILHEICSAAMTHVEFDGTRQQPQPKSLA